MKDIETSNISHEHRTVVNNLEHIIRPYIKSPDCAVIQEASYTWAGIAKTYTPDISLICGVRSQNKPYYSDVPRFIAEVISPSSESTDRIEKMQVYAEVGVEEYWLIDWRVPGGRIERYLLDDYGSTFLLQNTINGSEFSGDVSLILFPQIKFKMAELMEHIDDMI